MLNERKLTGRELDKRVEAIQGLLSNKRTLVKKYGKDAEKVMYGIATKQAKSKVEDMNKDKLKELIQQSLEGKDDKKPLPKPVAKDLKKMKTNFNDLKKRLKLEDTVDTGFSGRADYGEEDKALGQEDELEMKGLEEALNPEVSKELSRFIKAMAQRYDYTNQDAVYAIMAALRQRSYDGLNEDLDVGHQDNEPHMLKKELARAGQMIQMLYRAVDKYDGRGEVDFPQWWQAKIIKANTMLDSAFDYLDGEEMVAKIDAMIDSTDEIEVDIDVIDENIPSGNYAKGIEVIKKTLSKEGGAAGLEPLVKELLILGFKKSDVVKLLKNMISVKKHRDGDYILLPLEEGIFDQYDALPNRGNLDFNDILYLRGEVADLKDEISQIYRDMEQEAEPEGGEIANMYGNLLNKAEAKLYRMQKQLDDYDMNESILKEYVDFKDRSRDFQLDSMAQYEYGQDYNQLSMERQLDLIDRLNDIMSEGINEGASKEDQLKIAWAAFEKAEMNGDIRGEELALAAIELIKDPMPYGNLKEMKYTLDSISQDDYGKNYDELDPEQQRYMRSELEITKGYPKSAGINEAIDGGQVFDYFASKGYVVKERTPDGYPKKEGVEGFQVTDRKDSGRRSDNPQTVIFQYNPSTDQFTISQMSGYKIDQVPAIKAGMKEQGMTWAAGIDSYITDGNYNPVNISAKGLKDIVDHVMGGLSREAKVQKDFYADRGSTSGTVDERISSLVKEKLSKQGKKKVNEEFKVGDKVTMKSGGAEMEITNSRKMFGSKLNAYSVKKSNGKTAEYDESQLKLSKQGKSVKENKVADKDIEKEIKLLQDENPKGFEKEIKKLKVRQAALKLSK